MFQLRTLPFDPKTHAFISEQTCNYHYGKHHATYVNNLNNLIKGTGFENAGFYEILVKSSGGLFNNVAQVYNHDFYWDCVAKKSEPTAEFKGRLDKEFPNFKEDFIKAATTLFGSGWAWLVYNPSADKLEIVQTSNAATPVTDGKVPLLVVDVWEHAYYIDSFNARPAYLEKFYENINWDFVSAAYEWAIKEGLGSVKFYINELHGDKSCGCGGCGCH